MNKIMSWLSDSFAPKVKKLFAIPWIACVAATMQKIIPFILTGSVIYFYNVIQSFFPVLPDLSPIASFSFGLITLIATYMICNQAMEKLNHPAYTINAGLTGIGVLLMAAQPIGENADSLSAFLGNIGPAGLGVGIIVGLYTSLIYHLWGKLEFMSDSSMPDFITSWINNIVPALISLGIAMVLIYTLNLDIYSLIMACFMPLINIGQTLPGFILICLVPAFFYTLGISSWTFNAITTPIFLAGINANIEAVANGLPATNIVTNESVFTLAFITMGGMCATLGLNILMCFSKSKQLKTLGRVFIVPSIFNINEPIMFGAPVVFNPFLMIPAWINSIIGPVYVWVLMSTGLLNIPSKMIQVGQIPAPISSIMITEDWRAIIWWIILLVIYTAVWFPFFKAFEKDRLALEQTADTAAEI